MFADLRADDVYDASERLRGVAARTALRPAKGLAEYAGCDVYLKLESEQVTGSFKIRGAFNAIASLAADVRARGVVASSAGNHGLGVAWTARHFGAPALIFVPKSAPTVKRSGIEALGATVDAESPDYDTAMARAKAHAASSGMTFIHPCLGAELVAGQGTVALEILEDLPGVATIVVPVGGGGLLAGTGSLLRRVAPGVRIIGAQSVHTAAMARSIDARAVVSIPVVPTLADGLAGDIDAFALDVGQHSLDQILTVSEESIGDAIAWLAHNESLVVEGSGAVGVAAILDGTLGSQRGPLAVVVSGRNIDPERHRAVIADAATRPPETTKGSTERLERRRGAGRT
ncbi:MAG TPA: threonine/serine dehydratase [Gemmatimonadaceae bacterium]|nr:threonine/serine dehydratase [Gemmatimonadaceae bacterium]